MPGKDSGGPGGTTRPPRPPKKTTKKIKTKRKPAPKTTPTPGLQGDRSSEKAVIKKTKTVPKKGPSRSSVRPSPELGVDFGGLGSALKGFFSGADAVVREYPQAVIDYLHQQPHGKVDPEVERKAKKAAEFIVGENIVKAAGGKDFDPKWLAIEAALLPANLFAPLKGATVGTTVLRGATRAPGVARAARAGAGVAEAKHAVSTPLLRIPGRKFRTGGATATIPSARARTGRLFERTFDSGRKFTSRVGVGKVSLVKNEVQKTAQAAQHRMKHDAKVQMLPAVVLKKAVGGLRNKVAYQYALRAMAMGIDPMEAASFHASRAQEAADDLVKSNHLLHVDGYMKAAKYVVRRGDELELVDTAPERLRTAWRLFPEASEARESILKGLGLLDEDEIASRIQNPGRIIKGAKYVAEQEHAMNVIRASPERAQLLENLKERLPEAAAEAQIRVLDAQALKAREEYIAVHEDGIRMIEETLLDDQINFTVAQRTGLRQKLRDAMERLEDAQGYDWMYRTLIDSGNAMPAEVRANYEETVDMMRRQAGSENVTPSYKKKPDARGKDDPVRGEKFQKILRSVVPEGYTTPFTSARREFLKDLRAKHVRSLPARMRGNAGMRVFAMLDTLISRGERGRFWYRDSAKRIIEMNNGDLERATKMASLVSIYSPQMQVVPNLALAKRAMDEFDATGAITIGDEHKIRKATQVMKGDLDWEGRKTSNFYRNLLKYVDPKRFASEGFTGREVTADLWMSRAFGYKTDTVSDGRYDVIEKTIQHLADERGWEPDEVQAAIWVAAKDLDPYDTSPNVDFAGAADRNTFTIATELTRGINELGADLTVEQTYELTSRMLPVLENLATRLGVKIRSSSGSLGSAEDIRVVEGGYESSTNVGVQIDAFETEETLQRFVDHVATALDQWEVWAVKPGGKKPTLHVFAPELDDPEVAKAFFRILNEEHPDKLKGFTPHRKGSGISIVSNGAVPNYGLREWADTFQNAINRAQEEVGISVRYSGENSSVVIGEGVDLAEVPASAVGRSGASGSERALDSDAIAEVRAALERELANVRESYGQVRGRDAGGAAGRVAGDEPSGLSAGVGRRGRAQLEGEYEGSVPRFTIETPPENAWENLAPGATQMLHGVHRASQRGATPGMRSSQVYVSEKSKTPVETWAHELAHFWQAYSPKATETLTKLYGEDREMWVEAWIEYVLDPAAHRNATGLVRAFDEMSKAIQKEFEANGGQYIRGALYDHPAARKVLDVFDSSVHYKELKGGTIRGAEDFTGGKAYTAFELGLPRSLRNLFAGQRLAAKSIAGLFGGKTVAGGFSDPSVQKQFRGYLLENGFYRSDVTNASYRSLAKAVKMDSIRKARTFLLQASTDAPVHTTDIPIYVEPDAMKRMPPELRQWFAAREDLPEDIRKVGKHVKVSDFDEYGDDNMFADLANQFFPSKIDGLDSKIIAQQIINGAKEPIAGVRWVPAQLLYEGDLFANPKAFFSRGDTWGGLEALGQTVDFVNDLMKLSVLQLNPAYIGMNLLGNLSLNLLQQGPLALMNLPRAAMLSRELSPDMATAVDHLMGRGISSMMTARGKLLKPSAVLADLTGELVDKIPRRAAFLHEAWAAGYRSADEITYLLSDANAADDLYEVTTRANDAIIDYERLSPFERNYVSRILFIYPWIKGATRYTFRFPLEHPVQALAFAYLYERQQALADEQLGERPWYAEFNLPIGTVERFGEEYPLTINPKQLVPFTTPLEFGQAIAGWIAPGEQNWQELIDILQPFYPALVTSLTGWDSFENKEVPTGIGTFIREAADIPIVGAIERLGQSDEERAEGASNRLYPRNANDDALRTFLGSLAPTPYNPEKGQFYAEGGRGKTPEERAREKKKEIEGFYDPAYEPKVDAALATKVEYEKAKEAARKRRGEEDLTDVELADVMLEVASKHLPELDVEYVRKNLNPMTASEIRSELEAALGWNIIEAATTAANERKRVEEARAEGSVVSANG